MSWALNRILPCLPSSPFFPCPLFTHTSHRSTTRSHCHSTKGGGDLDLQIREAGGTPPSREDRRSLFKVSTDSPRSCPSRQVRPVPHQQTSGTRTSWPRSHSFRDSVKPGVRTPREGESSEVTAPARQR